MVLPTTRSSNTGIVSYALATKVICQSYSLFQRFPFRITGFFPFRIAKTTIKTQRLKTDLLFFQKANKKPSGDRLEKVEMCSKSPPPGFDIIQQGRQQGRSFKSSVDERFRNLKMFFKSKEKACPLSTGAPNLTKSKNQWNATTGDEASQTISIEFIKAQYSLCNGYQALANLRSKLSSAFKRECEQIKQLELDIEQVEQTLKFDKVGRRFAFAWAASRCAKPIDTHPALCLTCGDYLNYLRFISFVFRTGRNRFPPFSVCPRKFGSGNNEDKCSSTIWRRRRSDSETWRRTQKMATIYSN